MFGGGGNLDPRKLQQMMEQMGVDMADLEAETVVIETADQRLVFDAPEVRKMEAQGQETYQVVGSPTVEDAGESTAGEAAAAGEADGPSEDDIDLVAQRAGVSERDAREALVAEDGDLAAAVARLE